MFRESKLGDVEKVKIGDVQRVITRGCWGSQNIPGMWRKSKIGNVQRVYTSGCSESQH